MISNEKGDSGWVAFLIGYSRGEEKFDGTNQALVTEEAGLDQIGLDKSYFKS